MPLVLSVNYPMRRIYLSAETVDSDLDTMDVYREVRALRRSDESHRKFPPMIIGGGNLEKIAGQTYTARFVRLLRGCRIVPYPSSHGLRLVRDTFTDDGFAGRDCFDRSELPPGAAVDVDVDFPEIETRTVGASDVAAAVWQRVIEAGLSAEEILRVMTSAIAGNATGLGGTGPQTFRSLDGTKDRMVGTVSGGTRTVTTRDGTP